MKIYILKEIEKGTCPASSRNIGITLSEEHAKEWEQRPSDHGYTSDYDEFEIDDDQAMLILTRGN